MATISVPQQDGEIVLTDASSSTTYRVSNGQVIVPDGDEAAHFLSVVPGAEPAADKSPTPKPAASTG